MMKQEFDKASQAAAISDRIDRNIREAPCVIAKLKARQRAEIWHDAPLKVGHLAIVSQLFTKGPGYEVKVVRVFDEGKTLHGKHLWRYEVEPTGQLKETGFYCNR